MTTTPLPPGEPGGPPPGPIPLQYSHDARRWPAALQCTVGVVGSVGAMAGSILLPVLLGGERAIVLGPLLAIIGLALPAIYFSRKPGRRPVALGIFIGVGICLLGAGACWVAFTRG